MSLVKSLRDEQGETARAELAYFCKDLQASYQCVEMADRKEQKRQSQASQ